MLLYHSRMDPTVQMRNLAAPPESNSAAESESDQIEPWKTWKQKGVGASKKCYNPINKRWVLRKNAKRSYDLAAASASSLAPEPTYVPRTVSRFAKSGKQVAEQALAKANPDYTAYIAMALEKSTRVRAPVRLSPPKACVGDLLVGILDVDNAEVYAGRKKRALINFPLQAEFQTLATTPGNCLYAAIDSAVKKRNTQGHDKADANNESFLRKATVSFLSNAAAFEGLRSFEQESEISYLERVLNNIFIESSIATIDAYDVELDELGASVDTRRRHFFAIKTVVARCFKDGNKRASAAFMSEIDSRTAKLTRQARYKQSVKKRTIDELVESRHTVRDFAAVRKKIWDFYDTHVAPFLNGFGPLAVRTTKNQSITIQTFLVAVSYATFCCPRVSLFHQASAADIEREVGLAQSRPEGFGVLTDIKHKSVTTHGAAVAVLSPRVLAIWDRYRRTVLASHHAPVGSRLADFRFDKKTPLLIIDTSSYLKVFMYLVCDLKDFGTTEFRRVYETMSRAPDSRLSLEEQQLVSKYQGHSEEVARRNYAHLDPAHDARLLNRVYARMIGDESTSTDDCIRAALCTHTVPWTPAARPPLVARSDARSTGTFSRRYTLAVPLADQQPVPSAPAVRPPLAARQPTKSRVPFSTDEDDCIRAGLRTHGHGKWKDILNDGKGVLHEKRTSVNIKDRVRSLKKLGLLET